MENQNFAQARNLLAQMYIQIVKDIPPEVGSPALWELIEEVNTFLKQN